MASDVKLGDGAKKTVFVPRFTAPAKNNPNYYSDKNPFYAARDGEGNRILMMPNCTAYAYGRLMELTGKGFDGIIGGDARTWYGKAAGAGLETGMIPKLGAVCCWDVTDNSAGHVSIVEKIEKNYDIVTSNSEYKGREFFLKTLTKASGYNYAPTRKFKGFIYCGVDFEPAESGADLPKNPIYAGAKITLLGTACYVSETAAASYARKSGVFYLWDANVVNGRIKITNSLSRVGVAGQVTCWINIADAGLLSAPFALNAGDSYRLSLTPVYDSETGKSIGLRSGLYYVWSAEAKNGRVRMTNSKARVGAAGQVSFWVDVSALTDLPKS